jgi:hypothetical protein
VHGPADKGVDFIRADRVAALVTAAKVIRANGPGIVDAQCRSRAGEVQAMIEALNTALAALKEKGDG